MEPPVCRWARFLLRLSAVFALAALPIRAMAPFHIGVVTGTVSQSEDDLRGAEALVKAYGAVDSGGLIRQLTYPDDFLSQQEAYIASVVALADDPLMKAIVVNQAIPGTAEAFTRVKAKRPDILCLAGEAYEDPTVICPVADLVVSQDFLSRGYTIVWAAKQMGAKTLVHISPLRHMRYEGLARRATIMEAACKEFGIRFAFEKYPDPTSNESLPAWTGGASCFICQMVPWLLGKYGENGEKVAIFSTNDAHSEPIIRRLLDSMNGIFIESDLPSTLMGYPGALGLDLQPERGDFPAILARVGDAVVARGGAGRFGTWAYSYGFTSTAGLGEFAIRMLQGKAKKSRVKDLLDAYAKSTPGAGWAGAPYHDGHGKTYPNLLLVYQDTYILGGLNGQHYLRTTKVKVPEKYLAMPSKYPAP